MTIKDVIKEYDIKLRSIQLYKSEINLVLLECGFDEQLYIQNNIIFLGKLKPIK